MIDKLGRDLMFSTRTEKMIAGDLLTGQGWNINKYNLLSSAKIDTEKIKIQNDFLEEFWIGHILMMEVTGLKAFGKQLELRMTILDGPRSLEKKDHSQNVNLVCCLFIL